MDKIKVYPLLDRVELVCDLGHKHNTQQYTEKFLYPTGETWVHDNGYSKNTLPVYKDAQGRTWRKHETIDYSRNTFYTCDGLNLIAYSAPPPFGKKIK